MRVQCAWCKLDIGHKAPYNNYDITHTICENCSLEMLCDALTNNPTLNEPELFEKLLEVVN